MLNALKTLGIRIALDDFGTGYSSLSYLQSLPLDRIKIDRSFIASLGRTDRSLAVVRAVIGLAHGLGLPVLAEGVETNEQLRTLIREGCDEMQGYLIGRPCSVEVYADVVIASEQSLPRKDDFELVAPGGSAVTAKIGGRDPSTNIAMLRLAAPLASPSIAASEPQAGAIALVIGADGSGGASARLGVVNFAGPEWHSSRGGLIDRRIVLDVGLARREEGGPVFDAAGGCLGMSTFGPRGQVIVIPTATVARIVPQLAKDGRIARGWLGVALQAVAGPDALRGA